MVRGKEHELAILTKQVSAWRPHLHTCEPAVHGFVCVAQFV